MSPPAPRTPPAVPGLQLHAVVGRGATSVVWSAKRSDTGQPVAVKVIAPERYHVGALMELAARESAILDLVEHDHIVRLHEVHPLADGSVAVVLDLADGGTLADLVAARGRLGPGETATICTPIASALAVLHDAGVIHGDLAPGNVLFTRDGRPMLTDFEAARLIGESHPPVVAGTPGFVAPEILAGGLPSPSADVYALGALMWFALTGRALGGPATGSRPIEAGTVPAPDRAEATALLGPGFAEPAVAMLAEDPAVRPSALQAAVLCYQAAHPEPVALATVAAAEAGPGAALTHRLRGPTGPEAQAATQAAPPAAAQPSAPAASRGPRPTPSGPGTGPAAGLAPATCTAPAAGVAPATGTAPTTGVAPATGTVPTVPVGGSPLSTRDPLLAPPSVVLPPAGALPPFAGRDPAGSPTALGDTLGGPRWPRPEPSGIPVAAAPAGAGPSAAGSLTPSGPLTSPPAAPQLVGAPATGELPGPGLARRPRRTSGPSGLPAWARATAMIVVAALCIAGLVALLVRQQGQASAVGVTTTGAPTASTGATTSALDPVRADPAAVVQTLAAARAAALMSGDPTRLASAVAPDSPLHTADTAILESLKRYGQRYLNLSFTVRSAEWVSGDATTARVLAVVDRGSYEVVGPSGERRAVAAEAGRPLVYTLTKTSAGWRIADVQA